MKGKNEEMLAELVCELTRNCAIKEEYFAKSFNLSPAQVRFLKLFTHCNSYSVKELCEKLNLSNGRITQIITSLENKKLITRKQDPKDKRNICVFLLPGSKIFITNMVGNYKDLHKIILSQVGNDKKKEIVESLEILVTAIQTWVKNK